MYQIFADGTLIYDSTIDDYKIGKGEITKEVDKSGSFVFSLYPDHFYYDRFVKLKTVVMVKKSGKVAFRGRVLNDVTDYWNKGDFTCEGELGFLQDSIIRPFEFTGTPADLFKKFIEEHNAQVDEFKRFKIGTVTVVDSNNYINRSTTEYPTTWDVLTSALTDSGLGGHIYVTHGDDGTEELPTIHYVADYPKTATQAIEFGVNLKDYTRTVKAEDVATAVIPLGTQTGDDGQRLTIADVNGGVDYLYNAEAVAARGWVFKTVVWDDVTLANNLKTKAQAWLDDAINLAVTIDLTAVDLHLLDRSIESYNVCEYVHATSKPHGFDAIMLCNRQTMDLLQPASDTVTLGYQTTTFTKASTQMAASISTLGKKVTEVKQTADEVAIKAANLETGLSTTLRISAEDGVTITDADGNTVVIDGKQLKANSVTADSINAENLHVSAANIDGTLEANQINAENLHVSAANIDGTLEANQINAENLHVSAANIDGTLEANQINAENLHVSAANIDGTLEANQINAENLHVSAANIDGTLEADQINLNGSITWGDLSDSMQQTIEGCTLPDYITSTKITETTIESPTITGGTITGGKIYGGVFYDLSEVGMLTLSYNGRTWLAYTGVSSGRDFFSVGGTDWGDGTDVTIMTFADTTILQQYDGGALSLYNVDITSPLSDALDDSTIIAKLKSVLGLS